MDAEILQAIRKLQHQIDELRRKVTGTPAAEMIPDGEVQLLYCDVGRERVAFLIDALKEVVPMAHLASIPEAPDWVAGMLNLRGQTIPVLDVYSRIQQENREYSIDDSILICQLEKRTVGMIVQRVDTVETVPRKSIADPPGDIPIAPYLLGIITTAGRVAFLLSIISLVATSDLPELL